MRNGYTDMELINGLRIQDREILSFIYKRYRPKVIEYVTLNSGTVHEAEDVLHDSIISMYRIVSSSEFKLIKSFELYFLTVCKNTWRFSAKTKKRYKLTESFEEHNDEITDDDLFNDSSESVRRIIYEKFRLLSKACQEVLKMYYFERLRMKEIAAEMNYKTEMIAVKKKFICLENLKMLVKGNPEYKKFKNDE